MFQTFGLTNASCGTAQKQASLASGRPLKLHVGGIVKPIDYLTRIEPIIVMQFNAIVSAEKILYAERKCIEPEFDYYKYQYEQWTNLEEVDDMRVQYAHSRMGEAYQSLLLVDTACAAAASAVLQTAKQCISMTWAGKDRFAKGRAIGSQYISAVIWHSRNHALHFEEGWPL